MKVTFHEISVHGSKSGICPGCHKRASRSEKFYQTLNPFNTTADGRIKTRDDIYPEIDAHRRAWKAEPCWHVKCEDERRATERAAARAAGAAP